MQAGTRSGMSLDSTTALEGALQVDVNELLLRTDGSAIECECTAAYTHDRVMAGLASHSHAPGSGYHKRVH